MAYKNKSALNRLQKHLDFLSQLSKAKTKVRRHQLLTIATPEQLQTVCECIKNVLRGTVRVGITGSQKNYLKRYKPIFDILLQKRKRVPLEAKRGLLIQKGGFLPALLTPVLSIAGSLLGSLMRNI